MVHQIEGVVDLRQRHGVGDQVVDIDLPVHVPVDDLRHVGPPLGAAEGRAPPDAAGDQLERAGGDFLPGAGDADDHALAPTLVAAFQRLAHHIDVADAFERVVDAAVGQVGDGLNDVGDILR